MKIKHKNASQKAFTLIEILVVVVILSLLTTMALVQYNKFWQREQFRQVKTTQETLHALNAMYYAKNNEYVAEEETLTDIYDINDAFGTSFPSRAPSIKSSYINLTIGTEKYVGFFSRFYSKNNDFLYELQCWNYDGSGKMPLSDDNPVCIPQTQPCPDL